MIPILLLLAPVFFIGRYFSELAFEHERSRAGFSLLGIGVYIISFFLLGIIAAVFLVLLGAQPSPAMDLLLTAVSVALGAAATWMVWVLLKRSWGKQADRRNGLLDN
jgi:hypothetical protein